MILDFLVVCIFYSKPDQCEYGNQGKGADQCPQFIVFFGDFRDDYDQKRCDRIFEEQIQHSPSIKRCSERKRNKNFATFSSWKDLYSEEVVGEILFDLPSARVISLNAVIAKRRNQNEPI